MREIWVSKGSGSVVDAAGTKGRGWYIGWSWKARARIAMEWNEMRD